MNQPDTKRDDNPAPRHPSRRVWQNVFGCQVHPGGAQRAAPLRDAPGSGALHLRITKTFCRIPSRSTHQSPPITQHTLRTCILVALCFALALAPRVLLTGSFATVDEGFNWFFRVERFWNAVQFGDFAGSYQTEHPGITTLWLGTAGWLLYQALAGWGWLPAGDQHLYWSLLRFPPAFTNALCIALAYPLLRRLLNARVALLAVLLWALDPFLVAHGQLLHIDALLTSFMTLALLTAMVAFRLDNEAAASNATVVCHLPFAPFSVRWPLLVSSGVAAALAILTRSTAVLLIPMVGLIALIGVLRTENKEPRAENKEQRARSSATLFSLAGSLFLPLLLWFGIVTGVWVALFPSAWADLPHTVYRVFSDGFTKGAEAHEHGNFFLGQPDDSPGAAFYPVALVLRLTPWSLLGLFAVALARRPHLPDKESSPHRQSIIISLLLLCILLYIIAMSIFAKKADRYILPIFPMLNIIAAVGWMQYREQRTENQEPGTSDEGHWSLISGRWSFVIGRSSLIVRRSSFIATTALGIVAAATVVWYHPYELAYYNPLVGGGQMATWAIPVGWGEGLEKAADYINAHENTCGRPVIAWYDMLVRYHICNQVLNIRSYRPEPARMDYAVLYINQIQREFGSETMQMLWGKLPPLHIVRIHGINYAYVYEIARAEFGSQLYLRDYALDPSALRSSGILSLTLRWRARVPLNQDYTLQVRVFDPAGQPVARFDEPPASTNQPTTTWLPGDDVVYTHRLTLPRDIPAGRYQVTLSLHNPQDNTYLPLYNGLHRSDVTNNGTTLLLQPLTLPFEPYFGPAIQLAEHAIDSSAVRHTGTLHVYVKWQIHAPVKEDYILFLHVLNTFGEHVGQVDVLPGGPDAPTHTWQAGQEITYTHTVPLPPDFLPGRYRVALGLYNAQTLARLPVWGSILQPDAPDAGGNAVLLGPFELP